MSDWQPIETAPRDGTQALLFHPQFGVMLGYYDRATVDWWAAHDPAKHIDTYVQDGFFSPYMDSNNEQDPTHWMPLPEPPK